MKKNLLFVIGSLQAGGAERSLVSLLSTLPQDQFNIDLILISKMGLFFPMVPHHVNIIEPCIALKCLGVSPTNISFYREVGLIWWLKKIMRWQRSKRRKKNLPLNELWLRWRDDIEPLDKHYDAAIGYLDGFPNYFVIEKTSANRKILWNHSEYAKDAKFDEPYFKEADNVVTISSKCRQKLIETFPEIPSEKFVVLENITNGDLIRKMSEENVEDPVFERRKGKILLSIGRLTEQKNYSLSIKAAAALKERIEFTWFIIGEGDLREKLEVECRNLGLQEYVKFIGLRPNPYYYIGKADCFVMSSLWEGKSIAIDEAKIMGCPIVSTDYPTVKDNIFTGRNGLTTDFTPEGLADGIYSMLTDMELVENIKKNLLYERKGNVSEVDKYINVFNGFLN